MLLTSGFGSEDTRTVKKIAEAALRQGHKVDLFLMDNGVYNIPALAELVPNGASITICTHNADQRAVDKPSDIVLGSQCEWANLLHEADRVISFG